MGKVVAIGGSAGGIEALARLVSQLPPSLDAPVLVVVHLSPYARSYLPRILSRAGKLPAEAAQSGVCPRNGVIYVAPPDFHLSVKDGVLELEHGMRENGHRPSIDALFRSVALGYGRAAVGVVLSGALDDGTAGALAIRSRRGRVLVQDPQEASQTSMPQSVIDNVGADVVASAADLGLMLPGILEELEPMSEVSEPALPPEKSEPVGPASGFTCPDCHGALWELNEGNLTRYRCRIGHVFGSQTLQAAHADSVRQALAIAVRTLEEKAGLARRLAERAQMRGFTESAHAFEQNARDALAQADQVRELIEDEVAAGLVMEQ